MDNKKKLCVYLMYIFFLLSVIITVDYVFFLFYKSKIRLADIPKMILSDLELKVPVCATDKKSCFINFNEKKDPLVIRLGCFGDSFTYGAEVSEDFDYPSFLQRIFIKKGFKNVEVINFGQGAIGFHEAFLLWEILGKKYNLDYLIIGPMGFNICRDRTFNWSLYANPPSPRWIGFHSRFVLKKGDVKRVDVIGRSRYEIALNYFNFIPHWRYLRYEYEPPSFLLAPVDYLLPHRTLRNPFYYKKNLEEEMKSIYRILLKKIAVDVPNVIVAVYDEGFVSIAKELRSQNVHATQLSHPSLFPYTALYGHRSPCGNMLVAQLVFDYWMKEKESVLTVIRIADIERQAYESVEVEKHSLSYYDEIAIEINGIKIGRFYERTMLPVPLKAPCESTKNTLNNTVSLLVIKDSGPNLLESAFLPLTFEIKDKMPLVVRVNNDSSREYHNLGVINLLNKGLNIGEANVGCVPPFGSWYDFKNSSIKIKGNVLLANIGSLAKGDRVDILLDGYPILSANIKNNNENLEFKPLNGSIFVIRPDGREVLDANELSEESGIVYLALYERDGKLIKIPFARWFKDKIRVSYN